MIVKVCGMRDADNIRQLDTINGVDWIGLIFYPKSSRYVQDRPEYLPKYCKRVGVFVNANIDDILDRCDEYGLDMVQLHGSESAEYCSVLRQKLPHTVRIIKMIPISCADDLNTASDYSDTADYLLFETKCIGFGGSGQHFDWSLLRHYSGSLPFLLTGGIGPDDADAVSSFSHPRFAGIDLNSKFEHSAAIKDADSIRTFIQHIKH